MLSKFIWFFALFYGALALGYGLRRHRALSPGLMRATILLIESPLFIYSFWILDWRRILSFAPVPLVSILMVLLGLGISSLLAGRLFTRRAGQGSFVLATSFSNIGTTGGAFLCYLLFGLPGFSLAALYLFPYPILVFTLGFAVARKFSGAGHLRPRDYLFHLASNAVSAVPLLAMACGLGLKALGISPPQVFTSAADVLVRLDVGLMCLAIGMTLNPGSIPAHWRPIIAAGAVKFLVFPAVSALLAILFYGSLRPLPAKVLLIQAAMPPAIYAVITANLFSLDQDAVNALWLALTLLLIPIAGICFMGLG